jgi:hypothetical protein
LKLATHEEELLLDPDLTGGIADARGRCPIENPAIDPIPNAPLREPHPGEPGVGPDGDASPLENPA